MRKTPLNQAIRESIRRAMLDHKFVPLQKALDKFANSIADALYTELLTVAQRRQIAAAPQGWFSEQDCVEFFVDGARMNYRFSKTRRVPNRWIRNYNNGLHLAGNSVIGAMVLKDIKDHEAFKDERQATSMAVKGTLDQFKFVEDLITGWPEAKKFIPKDAKAAITTALAIPPQKLNAMLGLT